MSGVEPPLGTLRLRDPDEFIAGGPHTNPNAWELILRQHPLAQEILGWIRHRVDILHVSQPFSGSYKGVHYCSDRPFTRRFMHHARGSQSLYLRKRLITGESGCVCSSTCGLPLDGGTYQASAVYQCGVRKLMDESFAFYPGWIVRCCEIRLQANGLCAPLIPSGEKCLRMPTTQQV